MKRIQGIDGLRAIAVLAVIFYHLNESWVPSGFLGVDVFFVISGFLITKILLDQVVKKGAINLKQFWVKRARRILPALYTMLIFVCGFAMLVNTDLIVQLRRQVLGAITFSSNWVEIASGTNYFNNDQPALLQNLWSLGVEEQFYILWPITIAFLLAINFRASLFISILIATGSYLLMNILYNPNDASRVYYGTDTHTFGIYIGAILAYIYVNKPFMFYNEVWRKVKVPIGVLSLFGIIISFFKFDYNNANTYHYGFLLVSVLTALLLATFLTETGPLQKLLSTYPFVLIGTRSYSLYLWHWPIFVILEQLSMQLNADKYFSYILPFIVLIIAFLCAEVSYSFIEAPILRSGLRRTLALYFHQVSRFTRSAFVIGTVWVLCLGLTITALFIAPTKTKGQIRIEAAMQQQVKSTKGAASMELPQGDTWFYPKGEQLSAIGDSMLVISKPDLVSEFPGVALDAKIGRAWPETSTVIDEQIASDTLRPAVLIVAGTNMGLPNGAYLDDLLNRIGPNHEVVLVNCYAIANKNKPKAQTCAEYVGIYNNVAKRHNNVIVADWASQAKANNQWLDSSGFHPNQEGTAHYIDTIKKAFKTLSERKRATN
ncbi:MAG: acyltransferase family protein [Micrococcaceae bacterium]